jgi:hypothetical protein
MDRSSKVARLETNFPKLPNAASRLSLKYLEARCTDHAAITVIMTQSTVLGKHLIKSD